VVEAYTDDSGEPPVFLLAGFVAHAGQWSKFSAEWQTALSKPPRLAYFKMKEAHALRGQFSGWSTADRDRRLAELANIIMDYASAGTYSIVRQDDYNALIRGKVAKPIDHPYWLMCHSIMGLVFEWGIDNGIAEQINFIFDEQHGQSDQVLETYSAFYDQADPKLRRLFGACPVYLNDRTTLPLQAADMLAWHLRRSYFEMERGVILRSDIMDMLSTVNTYKKVWTKASLEKFISSVETVGRQSGKVTFHENRRMEEMFPDATSSYNIRLLTSARPNSSLILAPFLARGTGRFLLVHSCPRSSSPHLHRRSGGECSLASRPFDSAPRQ